MSEPSTVKGSALRQVPSVDQLLRTEAALKLRSLVGASRITAIVRGVTEGLREEIQNTEASDPAWAEVHSREALLLTAVKRLETAHTRERLSGLRRVINATGVILHTNLGRAPLSAAARKAVASEASGYCTLEYDAAAGSRGRRGGRVEDLLIELTGAEDALAVNNCASAALLILAVLAADGETIVSRGELVEIGGDFRIPDVMKNSGTQMIEVGTTNRTRLDDYRRAINKETRLVMRVHPSNYRIVGFTTSPGLSELASLTHEAGLPLYEDAGSGVLVDLSKYGLAGEPIIKDCVSEGADVVSFSGDKLLGSSQAGLIVGRREIVSRLRKHSLYRALRSDKLCLAALEATLDAHRREALDEIPALHMLALSSNEIEARVRSLIERLSQGFKPPGLLASIKKGQSAVGGGSGPNTHPATVLLALQHETLSADEIESRLRSHTPPIIARIAEGKVLLDLRTVAFEEEPQLIDALMLLAP
ncbi:MAG: L-seryl-tRNA(Sec) selenium transferase [Pyrinomonadaceae bacterium]